ncbi:MAG: ABC transporter permease, partial [Pseudomonadota bacterium]|nr:ABC transporter permease [Pseudomonadota bacterium]
ALAVLLLSSAGVIAHGLYAASHRRLGFASDDVVTFELAPVKAYYPDAVLVQDLSQALVHRLRAIPGVTDAAVTTNLPASDALYGQFQNGMKTPDGKQFSAQFHGVGSGFFELFAIALREGRVFTRNDTHGSEPVAVVSQGLADAYYGGHAVGKTIMVEVSSGPAQPVRIVGVVDDTYQLGPLQSKQPMLYMPLAQMPEKTLGIFLDLEPLRFAIRGHGSLVDWRADVARIIAEVVPGQPIAHLRSMDSIVKETTADARISMLLVGLFASLSLLLAAAGMYAVMAVAVAAREREFGVRAALGASPLRLVELILHGGLLQIAIGLVIGNGLAWLTSRLLTRHLVALSNFSGIGDSFEPLVVASVCVLLALSGLVACLLPALRAGRVHPMCALRGE